MAKFAVSYVETYKNTYIVEADTYEEAEEKLREKAEDCEIEMDFADSFDEWEVMPSEIFGENDVSNKDVSYYQELPE